MTKAELTVAIEQELTSLTRVSEVVAQLLEAAGQDLRPWHAAAGAKYESDLFMGWRDWLQALPDSDVR